MKLWEVTMKEKLQFCLDKISLIRSKLPKKKPHSEKYYKMIAFLNKYSLVFHFILACVLTFAIEVISRRDFLSTISFLHNHTLAYLYNAFIVFASLSIVYLFRCRAQLCTDQRFMAVPWYDQRSDPFKPCYTFQLY